MAKIGVEASEIMGAVAMFMTPKQIENYDLTDKINYHTLQEKKINLGDFVEDIIKIARELD